MKRSYMPTGSPGGYGEGMPPPPKMAPPPYTGQDFSQDDFDGGGGDDFSYASYGQEGTMSYDSSPYQTSQPRITDKLQLLSGGGGGGSSGGTFIKPAVPKAPASLYQQGATGGYGDYQEGGMQEEGVGGGYGYAQGGGGQYQQAGSGGDAGGYDLSYSAYGGEASSDWGYESQDYGNGGGQGYGSVGQQPLQQRGRGGGGGGGGGGGSRGQARGWGGQGQSQGQTRGRGRGQGLLDGGGYQLNRGGGRGAQNAGGGGGQRGRSGGRGGFSQNWGQGQSYNNNNNNNYQGGGGGGYEQRGGRGGRGRGGNSGYNNNVQGGGGSYGNGRGSYGNGGGFSQQTPRGRGGRGFSRGGNNNNARGRGAPRNQPRGRGGVAAGQVKAVSDNIMGMVLGRGARGKGRGRGGLAPGAKPASLMDLVDTAYQRKFAKTPASTADLSPEAVRFSQFLEFFLVCPDRVNGIQTLGNALTASRLSLQFEFEAEQLIFILKPLFTGVLKIGGLFLTRGLGLSKKAVKHDCFERAVQLMRSLSLEELVALEDCGKESLKEEVKQRSEEDMEAFKAFLSLKSSSTSDASVGQLTGGQKDVKKQPKQKQASEADASVKIRSAAVSEAQVPERNFPLADKMMMLVKEMEKSNMEEQDVAMASRFDVLCFKVGISVTALFRLASVPENRPFPLRSDTDTELICELYYDDVRVAQGQGRPRKEAQSAAYKALHERLKQDPVALIAQGPKVPVDPQALPDYFEIIHKGAKPQEGNNHQRLCSLRTHPPDLTRSIQEMVIMEMRGDTLEDNAYKILEFSASKNSMLIQWKQLDKGNNVNGFRCEINLNQQKTVVGMGASKPKARNAAAAMLLLDMYQTHDVVTLDIADNLSKAVSLEMLRAKAEELKAAGPPRSERVEVLWGATKTTAAAAAEKPAVDATAAGEEDGVASGSKWMEDALRPWLEDAIMETLEAHAKKITLEELMLGPGVLGDVRRFVQAAARACLLSAVSRNDPARGAYLTFHQRGVLPEEMTKILRINQNNSGCYKLLRDNKPMSVTQKAQFVRTFPDVWRARALATVEQEKAKKLEKMSFSGAPASAEQPAASPSINTEGRKKI